MICVRCNTENAAGGKYCRSCGAALGAVCPRCGSVTEPADRFCTSCGLNLEARPEPAPHFTAPMTEAGVQLPSTKQYSHEEIKELLALRQATRRESAGQKTLSQDDVDKLFG